MASPSVALLHWPRDAERREELAAVGTPRLLIVDEHASPPLAREDEDWIRVPADERDLFSRIERLERLHRAAHAAPPELVDGLLRAGDARLALSPTEVALVERLLPDFERVVTRRDLVGALWGTAPRAARSLDSLVSRARARLHGVGLTIAAVRGRGFTLAWLDADDG